MSGKATSEAARSSAPRPTEKVTLPGQSKRCLSGRETGSRRRSTPQIVPAIPSGTLIRKTSLQSMAVRIPPITGPVKKPAEKAMVLIPRPRPTLPLRKASVTMAALLVKSSAPPTP